MPRLNILGFSQERRAQQKSAQCRPCKWVLELHNPCRRYCFPELTKKVRFMQSQVWPFLPLHFGKLACSGLREELGREKTQKTQNRCGQFHMIRWADQAMRGGCFGITPIESLLLLGSRQTFGRSQEPSRRGEHKEQNINLPCSLPFMTRAFTLKSHIELSGRSEKPHRCSFASQRRCGSATGSKSAAVELVR